MGRGQVNRNQYTHVTPHNCLQKNAIDMAVHTVAFAMQTHVRSYKRQSYRHEITQTVIAPFTKCRLTILLSKYSILPDLNSFPELKI